MCPQEQRDAFKLTLHAIYRRSGPVCLNREPTLAELGRSSAMYADQAFPGCISAVVCMHLYWKICPRVLKGRFHTPKHGKLATISCEPVADSKLYCWHWFAEMCGTNNDITAVDNRPLLIDTQTGVRSILLPEGFVLNGATRNEPLYHLADEIYPEWSKFVKLLWVRVTDRERYLTEREMSVCKDVERLFGVLQGRIKILRHESFEWSDSILILISQVCVILQAW